MATDKQNTILFLTHTTVYHTIAVCVRVLSLGVDCRGLRPFSQEESIYSTLYYRTLLSWSSFIIEYVCGVHMCVWCGWCMSVGVVCVMCVVCV